LHTADGEAAFLQGLRGYRQRSRNPHAGRAWDDSTAVAASGLGGSTTVLRQSLYKASRDARASWTVERPPGLASKWALARGPPGLRAGGGAARRRAPPHGSLVTGGSWDLSKQLACVRGGVPRGAPSESAVEALSRIQRLLAEEQQAAERAAAEAAAAGRPRSRSTRASSFQASPLREPSEWDAVEVDAGKEGEGGEGFAGEIEEERPAAEGRGAEAGGGREGSEEEG